MLTRNLFFLFAITLFALASVVLDIFNYNPFGAKTTIFLNFYLSLFLTLAGILSFLIYYIKVTLPKNKIIYLYFWSSVRQAVLISISLTTLLFLKSLNLFDWIVGISTVAVFFLLELFFQTKKPLFRSKGIK